MKLLASAAAAALAVAAAGASKPLAANATCDNLLFAFFQGDEKLYYAYSADGLHWTVMNGNKPVMGATVGGTSIRDPYIHMGPDGQYHLVSTNGAGFGNTPTILTWSTADLITYSAEVVADVMGPQFFPPPASVANTWAPEWVRNRKRRKIMMAQARKTSLRRISPM